MIKKVIFFCFVVLVFSCKKEFIDKEKNTIKNNNYNKVVEQKGPIIDAKSEWINDLPNSVILFKIANEAYFIEKKYETSVSIQVDENLETKHVFNIYKINPNELSYSLFKKVNLPYKNHIKHFIAFKNSFVLVQSNNHCIILNSDFAEQNDLDFYFSLTPTNLFCLDSMFYLSTLDGKLYRGDLTSSELKYENVDFPVSDYTKIDDSYFIAGENKILVSNDGINWNSYFSLNGGYVISLIKDENDFIVTFYKDLKLQIGRLNRNDNSFFIQNDSIDYLAKYLDSYYDEYWTGKSFLINNYFFNYCQIHGDGHKSIIGSDNISNNYFGEVSKEFISYCSNPIQIDNKIYSLGYERINILSILE